MKVKNQPPNVLHMNMLVINTKSVEFFWVTNRIIY